MLVCRKVCAEYIAWFVSRGEILQLRLRGCYMLYATVAITDYFPLTYFQRYKNLLDVMRELAVRCILAKHGN